VLQAVSTSTPGTANAVNVNVFSLAQASTSSTARIQYQILTSSSIGGLTSGSNNFGNSDSNNDNRPVRVRLVQRGGERYYVVSRDSGSNFTSSSGSSGNQGSGTGTGSTTASGNSGNQGSGTGQVLLLLRNSGNQGSGRAQVLLLLPVTLATKVVAGQVYTLR
jgi:hypothetical protein